MEEDIKILKNTLEKYCYKNCKGEIDDSCKECKRLLAIENLIKGYRELEEKYNNQLSEMIRIQEESLKAYKQGDETGTKNGIVYMKSKIKEKIEELETKTGGNTYHVQSIINAQKRVLQELMEDK